MRRRVLLLLLVVVGACASRVSTITTSTLVISTTRATTTTVPPVLIDDCSAPPTTFSVLCETVERVLKDHFEPPALETLAAGSLAGVMAARPEASGEEVGRLTCAVPTAEFDDTCEVIDRKVHDDGMPLDALVAAAVDGVLSVLDPYNIYLPPSLANAVGDDGVVPGVGVVIGAFNVVGSPCVRVAGSCPLTVATVVPGSAAAEVGIEVGDVIVSIDGQAVDGLAVAEAAALLAGDPGSAVDIGLEDRQVALVRADQGEFAVTGEMVGDTAYIRIAYFELETHLLLHSYLQAFLGAGADRIVLDLRDNPGGYLFSTSLVGSEFLASGDLYLTQERTGEFRYPAVEGGIATRVPLTAVVNEYTASAAEILAAILQERDRARIVGVPTFGKNLVQIPFDLRNGGVLRLSIATWTTPGGFSVAESGVVPDVELALPADLSPAEVVDLVLTTG